MFGEAHRRPRVVVFGLPGIASSVVFEALREADVLPVALVLPASAAPHLAGPANVSQAPPPEVIPLGARAPEGIVAQAWTAGVPVLVVRRADKALADALASFSPDLALIACFSQRLPAAVLRVPRLGCLNLHPSLLPAYRGPAPLFWQFRDGLTEIGVTAHWMDEALDTGPIAAQRPLVLPEGIGGPRADRLWAQAGAELALEVMAEALDGRSPRWPQPDGGSHQGFPQPSDFAVSTDWPARRAFVFMRGTAEWGRPYEVAGAEPAGLSLAEAVGYTASERGNLGPAVPEDAIAVRFTPGVLWARPATR